MHSLRTVALPALALMALAGCDDSGGDLPTTAPERVTLVASDGFSRPGDAVASPDGATFYFTAYTTGADSQPAIFGVSSSGGAVTPLVSGAPLEYPTGLVMSCDGSTVYVADKGMNLPAPDDVSEVDDEEVAESDDADLGGIYTLSSGGGALTRLTADGIAVPSGLALSVDCQTLYVTGHNEAGEPAVFSLPVAGGAARQIHAGAPLSSPTGVHVDADNVAWVMDHLSEGADGPGVLFAVTADGITEVVSNLRMGTPGGVSLTAGGGTAVIPTRDDDGNAQLLSVRIDSGEITITETPDVSDPAGVRTAREAGVFALVDSEGGAIYRAE